LKSKESPMSKRGQSGFAWKKKRKKKGTFPSDGGKGGKKGFIGITQKKHKKPRLREEKKGGGGSAKKALAAGGKKVFVFLGGEGKREGNLFLRSFFKSQLSKNKLVQQKGKEF